MSMVLFFGLVTVVLIVGAIMITLTVRHHWGKNKSLPGKTSSDTTASSAP